MAHTRVAARVFLILFVGLTHPSPVTAQATPNTRGTQDPQAVRERAEQGDPMAQYDLGRMYDNGAGVPQDEAHAAICYQKAADQGHVTAQYTLGMMYATGQGVPQDDEHAVAWYRKAADQGSADAQFNLGVRYANGRGVLQSDEQSVNWYRSAADQGDARHSTTSR